MKRTLFPIYDLRYHQTGQIIKNPTPSRAGFLFPFGKLTRFSKILHLLSGLFADQGLFFYSSLVLFRLPKDLLPGHHQLFTVLDTPIEPPQKSFKTFIWLSGEFNHIGETPSFLDKFLYITTTNIRILYEYTNSLTKIYS